MPKAVRFEKYGGIDVLKVVDVDRPVPRVGQGPVRLDAQLERELDVAATEGVDERVHPPAGGPGDHPAR